MIPELQKELRLFCGVCFQYVDKVIELIEVNTDKQSYITKLICVECFKKMVN